MSSYIDIILFIWMSFRMKSVKILTVNALEIGGVCVYVCVCLCRCERERERERETDRQTDRQRQRQRER